MNSKMKCFALCFKKHQNSTNKTSSKELIQECFKQSQDDGQRKNDEPSEVFIEESKDKCEKQLNRSSRKEVSSNEITFNPKMETYEEVATTTIIEVPAKRLVNNEDQSREDTFSDYITSSSSFKTYPPNHMFSTFKGINEEREDVKLEGSNLVTDAKDGQGEGDFNDNGVGDQKGLLLEESSDSLFSISLDSKKHTCFLDLGDKEVNSPLKKRDHNAVMNPVEGLIQLKAIKSKATLLPSLNQVRNENVNMEKQFHVQPDTKENEVASACDSTDNIKSSNRVQNRPILGELRVKEINQLSNCLSPRGTESCGKYETPKVGTVGSYWKHSGQTTPNSASRFHSRGPSIIGQGEAKCSSTAFQIRLERAVENDTAQKRIYYSCS